MELSIKENKASSGIIGKQRQLQNELEEAEYGREQFITCKVEMSISYSNQTEVSQKSDIKGTTQGHRRNLEKAMRV